MVEPVIRILEVVEAPAALDRVRCGPSRPGPERVEVEVEAQRAQRVRRVVLVAEALSAGEHAAGLVERGVDLVGDPLLPVRCGTGGLLQQQDSEQGWQHVGSDARSGIEVSKHSAALGGGELVRRGFVG